MKQTPLWGRHTALGARMVEFAGWQMPIQYTGGIVAEHLAVRRSAGIFDVSHMGRFRVTGAGARAFLRQALTNDCDLLPPGSAQYTILANEAGGAIDDAFLYRPAEDKYLLVVNASNKDKDLAHLQALLKSFKDTVLEDVSQSVAMIALQGPQGEQILQSLLTDGVLPAAHRNALSNFKLAGLEVCAARTGYTGEPVCFEIFLMADCAVRVWDKLMEKGALPIGLGARDTLRLEAGLPLYGHELGMGKDGLQIPVFAIGQARFAVDLNDPQRPFAGRKAMVRQSRARTAYQQGNYSDKSTLPKLIRTFRLLDSGIAREGALVYSGGRPAGWVTSGTMIPYWDYEKRDDAIMLKETHSQRAIGLCMIEPDISVGAQLEIEVRGKNLRAQVVSRNLQNTGRQTRAVL
ncbi:MAG: glycine cleavage system aminomethyltransferase GcvT [Planctomycetaceae bacterium]|nr:glycine cleavage system aminomethyltransferase GcvT [Planctomycetaceae bacterium]